MSKSGRVFPENLLPQGHDGNSIDLSSRFCYFLDLNNWSPPDGFRSNNSLKKHKQQLFNSAQQALVNSISQAIDVNGKEQEETIKTAIEFLGKVAENERKKEIKIITQYADELEKNLPTILKKDKKSDIKKLIERVKNFAENPQKQNIENFYEELTICINTIRNSASETYNRIEQIISNNRKTFNDLAADNMSFRFGSDVESLIRNIIGLKEREVQDSFASNTQKILIDYIIELINEGKVDIDNFWPAVIGLLGDFESYLMEQKSIEDTLKDFSTLKYNDLKQIFNTYISTPRAYLYALENNTRQLENIFESLKSNLGLETLKEEKEIEARNEEIKKRARKRKNNKPDPNYGRQQLLQAVPNLYRNIKHTKFLNFNVEKGRAGIMQEVRKLIKNIGQNVGSHAATDIITINLGTLTGDINLQYTDLVLDGLKPFIKEIEDFEKKERQNALDDLQEDFEQMNFKIENFLHQLDELIHMPDGKQLFIYHETLKLYVRIEEHKTNKFEGRELQILSALDRIYSMNEINGLILPDRDILYNLALNLADNAVGGKLKGEVEDYLSIFAGLLMFDDIANMAKEASVNALEAIQYNNLNNIHLYLLNDIYVPGSMILSYIHKALLDGWNNVASSHKYLAEANIDASGASDIIADYLATHPYGSYTYNISQWSEISDSISAATKLKIMFMSSFTNFLRDLQKHFK